MRRDFLKGLGIEDKEIIDKILDENSSDIGRAKGELDSYKEKVATLETEIQTKNDEIKTLQATVDKVGDLETQVATLTTENTKLTADLTDKVNSIQKTHAIENGIRDAKGKNVKAIMALLDDSKITFNEGVLDGLSAQLETLATAEDSSMLFGDTHTAPSGTTPSNPPSNGGAPATSKTLAEAVAKALSK